MIKSIFIIAMLALILPACAKPDSNQSINQTNQTMYLNGFDEGYKLGVLAVLAQSNTTIAQEYNALVQQHNDLLNKTLSAEGAKAKLLAKVPLSIPAAASEAPAKPSDPWDL